MGIEKPKYKKVLFCSDIHAPYYDRAALNAFISFAKWWKPDHLVFLGDVIDFYAVSSFVKDPRRALELQNEIDETNDVIDRICAVLTPTCQKTFIAGNHEERMQKFLWSKASQLSGLDSLLVGRLLKLPERGFRYRQSGRMQIRNTVIKHGDIVRKFCGYTAKGEFDSTGMTGVSGHSHRLGVYSMTNASGTYTWMECGCLLDLNQEYVKGTPNWQHGFGIGFYKDRSDRFDLETVRIVNGKAMYGGMEFS